MSNQNHVRNPILFLIFLKFNRNNNVLINRNNILWSKSALNNRQRNLGQRSDKRTNQEMDISNAPDQVTGVPNCKKNDNINQINSSTKSIDRSFITNMGPTNPGFLYIADLSIMLCLMRHENKGHVFTFRTRLVRVEALRMIKRTEFRSQVSNEGFGRIFTFIFLYLSTKMEVFWNIGLF